MLLSAPDVDNFSHDEENLPEAILSLKWGLGCRAQNKLSVFSPRLLPTCQMT